MTKAYYLFVTITKGKEEKEERFLVFNHKDVEYWLWYIETVSRRGWKIKSYSTSN